MTATIEIPKSAIKINDDLYKDEFKLCNLQNEIDNLTNEINSISTVKLSFDKWDYITVFSIAILEVAGDFFLGNPKEGLSKNLSDKNTKLGNYFNGIHEKLDHSNQPVDYQGFKFGGGDHRGRTFAHDLLMFPLTLYMLCKGQFIDGYYQNGNMNWVLSSFNQFEKQYPGMTLEQAILAYITHMFADFFSSKSLPVPGFGILAHFPNRDIRKLVNNMYSDGFNLRHMAVQGIPVLAAEILMRIYFYIRNFKEDLPIEAKKHKLNKMLLLSHGIATSVNIGKVIITENPAAINLPMLIRVITLVWSVLKEEINLMHRKKIKIEAGVLKNKYENMKTLILLDKAICYTSNTNKYLNLQKEEFDKLFYENENKINNKFNVIGDKLTELKNINSTLRGK